MAKLYVLNFHLHTENSWFGNLMGVGLWALTELHVCMEQQKRGGCSYNRRRI